MSSSQSYPFEWMDDQEGWFIWFFFLTGAIVFIDLYICDVAPRWMSHPSFHTNVQIKSSAGVRNTLHSDDNLTSTTTNLDTSNIATKDDISRLETLIQEQQETFTSKMKVQQETSTIALADIKTSIDYILKNQKSTQTYNKPSSNHNKTVRELELQEQLGEKCDTIYDMGRKLHTAQREISDMKYEMEQLRKAKSRAENLQLRFERNASQPRYEEVRKVMVVPITEQTPIRPQHIRSNTSAKIASVPPTSTPEKPLDGVPTSTVNDVPEKPLEVVPPPSLDTISAQPVNNATVPIVDNESAQSSINDVPEKPLESPPAPSLEVAQAQPVIDIPVQTVENEPAHPVNDEPKEALENVSIQPLDNGPAQPAMEESAQPQTQLSEQPFVPVSNLSAPFRRVARVRGSTNKATNKVTKKVRFAPQTTSMGGSRGKALNDLIREIPGEETNNSSGSGQPAAVVENAEEMEAVPTPTAEPPPASVSIPEVAPPLQCNDQPAPAPQAEDAAMGEAATTSSPTPEASDLPVVAKNINMGGFKVRDSPIYPPGPALSAPVRRRPTAIEMTEMAENGSPLYLPSRVRESTPAPSSSAPVPPAARPAVRPQFSVTDPRYTAPAPAFSPAVAWNRPAYSPYSPAPGSWVPPAPAGATLTPVEERMRRGRRGRL